MDLSQVYCHSFVKLNSIKYYILIFNSELIHALINQGIDNDEITMDAALNFGLFHFIFLRVKSIILVTSEFYNEF